MSFRIRVAAYLLLAVTGLIGYLIVWVSISRFSIANYPIKVAIRNRYIMKGSKEANHATKFGALDWRRRESVIVVSEAYNDHSLVSVFEDSIINRFQNFVIIDRWAYLDDIVVRMLPAFFGSSGKIHCRASGRDRDDDQ